MLNARVVGLASCPGVVLEAALPLLRRMNRELAMDSDFWADTAWIAGSGPVPCGMSRPAVRRSNMAGWTGCGYRPPSRAHQASVIQVYSR
jgi:hypothetical protein